MPRPLRRRIADRMHRISLRLAFRVARIWWFVRRPDQQGALIAAHDRGRLLLVRQSYQPLWTFLGGGVDAGESPAEAALRELNEEVGVSASEAEIAPAGQVTFVYLHRRDTVHFFDLARLDGAAFELDHREIVEARWLRPEAALDLPLVPHVRHYLEAKVRPRPHSPRTASLA